MISTRTVTEVGSLERLVELLEKNASSNEQLTGEERVEAQALISSLPVNYEAKCEFGNQCSNPPLEGYAVCRRHTTLLLNTGL